MTRRPALLTQAEVARAIRAARQAGASSIEVRPDGTIHVSLVPQAPENPSEGLERRREIVL